MKAATHDSPVGQVFGRWRVQSVSDSGRARWLCLCECGTTASVDAYSLRVGASRSCGCLKREVARTLHVTHGQHGTLTHRIWTGMKSRCVNPKVKGYANYGGRGIKVCKRWEKFENFLADMGACPPGLTIERKNNAGNYCKSNCYWATRKEQALNTRRTVTGMYQGKRWCMSDLAAMHGVSAGMACYRMKKRGWSFVDACTTQPRSKK